MCVSVCRYTQSVSFIVSPSKAALSHRNPASVNTSITAAMLEETVKDVSVYSVYTYFHLQGALSA